MSDASSAFGIPMLLALGIDSKHVKGFSIKCEAGEAPTIEVESFLPYGTQTAATVVLKRYRLEPIESDKGHSGSIHS